MEKDLIDRTKRFAIDCWTFCGKIPKSREYNAYVNKLIQSSGSVGASYRASQRAKSTDDFIHRLKLVEEEAEESVYWLEVFEEVAPEYKEEIELLKNEGNELLSIIILVVSINAAKQNKGLKEASFTYKV